MFSPIQSSPMEQAVGNKFIRDEIRAMLRVVYENQEIIKGFTLENSADQEDFFTAMAAATNGRRSVDEAKGFFFNVKKIREHEGRYSNSMKKALSVEERELLDKILFPGRTFAVKDEKDSDMEYVDEDGKDYIINKTMPPEVVPKIQTAIKEKENSRPP